MNIDNLIEWSIIEIELSEVPLGLKWYVWFEITSMNLDQLKSQIQSDKYRIF